MTRFATQPADERRLILEQIASRIGIVPVILEKDFWVTWVLGRIFETPDLAPHVVFKGGTALSKVFGVIDRFSEDVDLCVAPASLGFAEAELDDAPSATQRRKRMEKLTEACEQFVRERFLPALDAAIAGVVGAAPEAGTWLRFEVDPAAKTPNLWFRYPSALPALGGYITKQVKLEIGSLTRQQPTGEHAIAPLLERALGGAYEDFQAGVVALELERTFWEKATILHVEFHRPADKAIRDRFARHYADFAALWRHESRGRMLARSDVLQDVVLHKSRFFASPWASYETAVPGTFRLVPPRLRMDALAADYAAMQTMFLSTPPPFEQVMDELAVAEQTINSMGS